MSRILSRGQLVQGCVLALAVLSSVVVTQQAHATLGECDGLRAQVESLEQLLSQLQTQFAAESALCIASYQAYSACAQACQSVPACVDRECSDEYQAYGDACHASAVTNLAIEEAQRQLQAAREALRQCRLRRAGDVINDVGGIINDIRRVISY